MFKTNPESFIEPQQLFAHGSDPEFAGTLQADSLIQQISSAYYRPVGDGTLLLFYAVQNLVDDVQIGTGYDVQDVGQLKTRQAVFEIVLGTTGAG
ncbi:hypothetical protein DLM46_37110 [Paraburkholderia lacunae]|uniref:Uncharacterized protein n=2 Tax=Paraburkholderia lacunae TaxID=2211104 RepID=A0A370MW18_9BURK|nr:hypothetical protein DLM46_37110 [Paraburkholderia lacunae]